MGWRFEPGKRAWITGEHPWSGRAGVIVEAMEVDGQRGWTVEVDNTYGATAFVPHSQLRRAG